MDKKDLKYLILAVVVILIIVSFLFKGFHDGRSLERTLAIEAGAAEWQIDPKTGEKEFVYHAQSN